MPADNLVLVTIDALRRDALSCVGSAYASTPNLDALAAGGVLFEQAISNGPRTQSSFPSIMTSMYPLVVGERRGLPRGLTTLAEALAAAGFATAGFNPSNPFLTRETGYHRGFDLFIDFWDVHDRTGGGPRRGPVGRAKKLCHDAIGRRNLGLLMLLQALVLEEGGQYLSGELIAERALAWLARQAPPFFLWLHFMEAHFPYQPLPGRRTWRDRLAYAAGIGGLGAGRSGPAARALMGLYGQRVELVDGFVGRVVRGLGELGLDRTTLLAVTSDHGEQFGDHGRWAHGPDLHDELLRVPLILRGPGLDGPRRVGSQVELLGLAPTLLELLRLPAPASFGGTSFAPLAVGDSGDHTELVISEAMHCGGRRSLAGVPDTFIVTSCRRSTWKHIHDSEHDSDELFDLLADPGESDNVAHRHPDLVGEFRGVIERHRRRSARLASALGGDDDPGPIPDDALMRQRLAALGYL